MVVLFNHCFILGFDLGKKCLVGGSRFFKFSFPFVTDAFLLSQHLVMMEVSSSLLLTSPLVCVLLLQLERLHLRGELLYLLP